MRIETFELKIFKNNVAYKKKLRIFRAKYSGNLYGVDDRTLYIVRYVTNEWKVDSISIPQNSDDGSAKLLHVVSVDDSKDFLMIKIRKEMSMYFYENHNLQKIFLPDDFEYIHNWNKNGTQLKIGEFYDDLKAPLGVMLIQPQKAIKFYEIINLGNSSKVGNYFFCQLNMSTEILDEFSPNRSKLFLAKLKNQQKEMIITRDTNGLNVFELNGNKSIDFVMSIDLPQFGSDKERFLFPSLSYRNDDWNDVVLLNTSGLFIYQYCGDPRPTYKFYDYNPMFSEAKGWTDQHTETITFEDINGNGFDDMIFTGPGGIQALSYDFESRNWNSLIDTSQMLPQQRHSLVLQVIPNNDDDNEKDKRIRNPILFSQYAGALYRSELIEMPSDGVPPNNVTNVNISLDNDSKSFYLRDSVDWSGLLDAVNLESGRPKFTLPLIGKFSSLVKLHLDYDGSSRIADNLGVGWSLPKNFIFQDFQESIFEADATYFLVFDDDPYKLERVTNATTINGSHMYTLQKNGSQLNEKYGELQIHYYPSRSTWKINFGAECKLFYGAYGRSGARAYDLAWKNWRGPGSDLTNQMQRIHMWYLSGVDDQGIITNFLYKTITESYRNMAYTKEVYLKSIENIYEGSITLSYANKKPDEYKQFPLKDEEGNFNRMMSQAHYIVGYDYKTKTKQQNVKFHYDTIKGTRLLTKIEQTSDYIKRPVFEFEYQQLSNEKYSMKKITLPTQSEVVFDYTPEGITQATKKSLTVSDDYKITFGPDFILISYYNQESKQFILSFFNQEMTEKKHSTDSGKPWPSLGAIDDNVKSHEILLGDNFIVVVLHHSEKITVHTVGRFTNGDWDEKFKYSAYNVETSVHLGSSYILVLEPGWNFLLVEWNTDNGKWYRQDIWEVFDVEVSPMTTVAIYRNHFAVYENQQIFFGYKNAIENEWNLKLLTYDYNLDAFDITNYTLRQFELEIDLHNKYFNAYRKNALQMSHNLIVLNSFIFDAENKQFITKIQTFTIGQDYTIEDMDEIIVNQDNLSDLSPEYHIDDAIKFTLQYGYLQDSQKFKISLKTYEGPPEKEKQVIKEFCNSPPKDLYINFQKYLITLNGQNLYCNNMKYTFSGVKWNLSKIGSNNASLSIPLGSKFMLQKLNSESTVKLKANGTSKLIFDFGVKSITDIQNIYPIYLTCHPPEKSIQVVEIIDEKAIRNYTLPSDENLSGYENPFWLITYKKSQKELIFRSQYGVQRFIPNEVVTEKTIKISGQSGGSIERKTGYSYRSILGLFAGNVIVYKNVHIQPGNNVSRYGYIDLLSEGKIFYNGNGEIVKRLQRPPQNESSEKKIETPEEKEFRKKKSIQVVEIIDEKAIRNYTLPSDENLSGYENPFWLITYKKSQKELIFRSQYGVQRFIPNEVVTEKTIKISGQSGGSIERKTGYSYRSILGLFAGNVIVYKNVHIQPGNNVSRYGYIDLLSEGRIFYNENGEIVKRLQRMRQDESNEKNMETPEEKAFRKSMTLYDIKNHFEIGRTNPFSRISEMVGYYGFEDYEDKTIGNVFKNKSWSFNQSEVKRGEFALTGKNYLRLENGTLEGVFIPEYKNQEMVASCWIRTGVEDIPAIGSIVPYLRVSVVNDTGHKILHDLSWLSFVKLQIDDWSYLEVIIDMQFVQQLYSAKNETQNIDNLGVAVRIGPTNAAIDVDNVRFAPLSSAFYVNVYDKKISEPVTIITEFGTVKRKLFDKNEVQIAEINEMNELEKFQTYTKDSLLIGSSFVNPKCRIELIPEKGFYENFSPIAFRKRWKVTDSSPWNISPGRLNHLTGTSDDLTLTSADIDSNSFAIRFVYHLEGNASLELLGGAIKMTKDGDYAQIELSETKETSPSIPIEGEFLMVKDSNRTIIWIDGNLCIDQSLKTSNPFKFTFQDEIEISGVLLFTHTQVKVTYQNGLNENIQEISLSSSNAIVIRAQLYDELGRARLATQPVEVKFSADQPIMAYSANFVSNDNPDSMNSVWSTGRLNGSLSEFIGHQFGFSEIVYANDPLNNKIRIGLPGKNFTSTGSFARRYDTSTSNDIINGRWSRNRNFTHYVEHRSSELQTISVFDEKDQKVASLVQVAGSNDLLSTFDYNDKGLIIKIIPPKFYEKIGISVEENDHSELEKLLGTFLDYDTNGNLVKKTSPDEAPFENVYQEDLLRFVIQYSDRNISDITSVVYFKYDAMNRLQSTGKLKVNLPKEQLSNLEITNENADEFQYFHYSDYEKDPSVRKRIVRAITKSNDEPFVEESLLDFKGRTISRKFIVPDGTDEPLTYVIANRYEGNLLKEIIYPANMFGELFRVTYEYDKLGMTSVGVPGQKTKFMTMDYNANHQVIKEVVTPHSKNAFTREYKYNEPGFLVEINDRFLREEISYTEKAYGGQSYGDGTVTRTKYTAKWHQRANSNELGLREFNLKNNGFNDQETKLCLNALRDAGYLNENNQQMSILYPDLSLHLPVTCVNGLQGRKIRQMLGQFGFPEQYGFLYDYGNHMELTKAKYFVGNETNPLQPDIFAKEIPSINVTGSHIIWKRLIESGYVEADNSKNNLLWVHGKSKKPFIRRSLSDDLRVIDAKFPVDYELMLRKLLINHYAKRELWDLPPSNMISKFKKWFCPSKPHQCTHRLGDIYKMLKDKQYLYNPIDHSFNTILIDFSCQIPEIVGVLQQYFAKQLGEAEFDVESYDIDGNGNHRTFYAGFERFEINYKENTNQISELKIEKEGESEYFPMQHDNRGNVIQALHKGMELLEYHPVSNRLQKVKMTNGNSVTFHYDSNGERVLKRVKNARNEITTEMHYLRDDQGRTLVERKLTFVVAGQKPDVLVTMYIYGLQSLVGFVRRNQFYNVITDHQGSVRAVVREGEVVAAYDYMPYGTLMRKYGSDPDAHIPYRYTCQEWDEEIGLYNYHARFYDPSIGRFYQVDPKSQYFSPYKYAGNSPISMIDPSGEVAIINVASGALTAYLDAAAANDSFNPFKWNWKSPSTYIALALGFAYGFTMIMGFSTSVKAFQALKLGLYASRAVTTSLGVALLYIRPAIENESSNPMEWDYSTPKVYSALLGGATTGIGIFGSVYTLKNTWKIFGLKDKILLTTSGGSLATYTVFEAGESSNWDFTNLQFLYTAITTILTAADLPLMFRDLRNIATHLWKKTSARVHQNNEMIMAFQSNILVRSNYAPRRQGRFIIFPAVRELIQPTNYYNILSRIVFNKNRQTFSMAGTRFSQSNVLRIKAKPEISSQSLDKEIVVLATKNSESFLTNKDLNSIINELSLVNTKLVNQNKFDSVDGIIKIARTKFGATLTKKDEYILFSSTKSSGSLVAFDNKKLINPILIDVNSKNKIVTESEKSKIFQNKIKEFENELKEENKRSFQKIRKELEIYGKNEGFDGNTVKKELKNIDDKINDDGYIDKEFFEQKPVPIESDTINKAIETYKKDVDLEYSSRKYLSASNINNKKNFVTKLNEIKKNVKRDKWILEELRESERIRFANLFWDKLKGYKQRYALWEPTGGANNIHFIQTGIERYHRISPERLPSPFQISDIVYIELNRMKTYLMAKCHNCLITNSGPSNVISDEDWLAKIKEKIKEYRSKSGIQKKPLFLEPVIHSDAHESKNLESKSKVSKGVLTHQRLVVDKESDNQNADLLKNTTEQIFYKFVEKEDGESRSATANLLELGDNFLKNVNVSGGLLLLDMFLAKYRNRKLYNNSSVEVKNITPAKQNEFAIQIVELYEKSVMIAAKKAGIALCRLNESDSIAFNLQKDILNKIVKNDFNGIPSVMFDYAMRALPKCEKGSPGRLSIRKIQKFKNMFNELDHNKIINDILFQTNGLRSSSVKNFDPELNVRSNSRNSSQIAIFEKLYNTVLSQMEKKYLK